MSYSTTGPKPFEKASKSSHHHVINDPVVASMLKRLYVPPRTPVDAGVFAPFIPQETEIQHVVAIDGGYSEVPIQAGYPAASINFFQFGALHFKREDLRRLEASQHIAPEDMQRLKNIDRLKLPLATRGARNKDLGSLSETVRFSLAEFLSAQSLGENNSLMDTLAWFLFKRYLGNNRSEQDKQWFLSSNPYGASGGMSLHEPAMKPDFSFECPATGKPIYLSDAFRLHERIEEETGAGAVAGYIAGAIEHLILLHIIKNLARKDQAALKTVLFIMDRPTGWFGLTAPMHVPMLCLVDWLFANHSLFLAGLEKSGAFVEHARDIQAQMPSGTFLLLDDAYIYRHISPGEEDQARPYAATSYYGHKLIFKSRQGQMYVVSLPVRELKKKPLLEHVPNLQAVLTHVEELHCDMYENALMPIALANKLVSLSVHPSSQILKTFAKSTVAQS